MKTRETKAPRPKATRRAGGRGTMGKRLIASLTDLRDALATGRPLRERFTVRTVILPDDPRTYTPAAIRRTRERLNISQAVFARLLGVSAIQVRSLESGVRTASPMARRLLDTMNDQPAKWRAMVKPKPEKRPRSSTTAAA